MSRRDQLLREDEGYFGPGTDLAIALAAFLLFAFAVDQTAAGRGELEIAAAHSRQMGLIEALANRWGGQSKPLGGTRFGISLESKAKDRSADEIEVENDATLQRVSFGDQVLFQPDRADLLPGGKQILGALAEVLRSRLEGIAEIQIQGHADLRPSKAYRSNLRLAAARAVTVYETLARAGIDPSKTLLSATSFGEFCPVDRRKDSSEYSVGRLRADNASSEKRRRNRRIEILLIYRR